MKKITSIAIALSLCAPAAVISACGQSMPADRFQSQSTQMQLKGEIVLPYAVSNQTASAFKLLSYFAGAPAYANTVAIQINDLYRLEAVVDGQTSRIDVTDVRVDAITGQTYITYNIDSAPVFDDNSILEIRTVNGYWLGGALLNYSPGVIVVDITPSTSLDVVLAREGRIPGSLKIGDLSRYEILALGLDPDQVNHQASVRSIVNANGEVKANKLKKLGR